MLGKDDVDLRVGWDRDDYLLVCVHAHQFRVARVPTFSATLWRRRSPSENAPLLCCRPASRPVTDARRGLDQEVLAGVLSVHGSLDRPKISPAPMASIFSRFPSSKLDLIELHADKSRPVRLLQPAIDARTGRHNDAVADRIGVLDHGHNRSQHCARNLRLQLRLIREPGVISSSAPYPPTRELQCSQAATAKVRAQIPAMLPSKHSASVAPEPATRGRLRHTAAAPPTSVAYRKTMGWRPMCLRPPRSQHGPRKQCSTRVITRARCRSAGAL